MSSMKVIHESHPWKSSMTVIHESYPWKSSTTTNITLYQPNHTKPYQTIPNLQSLSSITAISIHNATLQFSEDRDCEPFSACYLRLPFIWKRKISMTLKRSERSKRYGKGLCSKMDGQTLICVSKVAYRTQNNSHICRIVYILISYRLTHRYWCTLSCYRDWKDAAVTE